MICFLAAHNSCKEANPVKKGILVLLCIVMAGMVLSGCAAGNASGTTATAAPIVTNSPMATATTQTDMVTMSPDMSPGMNAGASSGTMSSNTTSSGMTGAAMGTNGSATDMTPAQADRTAERIEEAVERLSEVDDAEVVIDSGNRVLVAIEFDDQYSAGLDDRMKEMILGERLSKATGLDELADDFGDLWNRITGM